MSEKSARTLPCVLIVNDDPVQQALLDTVIRSLPAHTVVASGVAQALIHMEAQETPPELIVSDLYMPEIDGWRFARLLRSSDYGRYNRTPLLLVSATYAGEDPRTISRETGADGFLALPASNERILETIRCLIEGEPVEYSPSVLVVDDEFTSRAILERAFSRNGYRVRTTETATEGRAAFAAQRFDIVLLDYHLPDGSGAELLREMYDRHPGIVYLMLTADQRPRLAVELLAAGASGYARKPVDPEYLLALAARARRERALLRVEEHLEDRTREVRRLLDEKELLLRELQHRVKNNLAAVAGLIEVRARSSSPDIEEALLEVRGNVENLMVIYDTLYTSGDIETISTRDHLTALVERIVSGYSGAPELQLQIEDLRLRTDLAMPIGIIVNELVTNACKYAYPDDRTGILRVSLSVSASGVCRLVVADEGVGMPGTPPQPSGRTGFGLAMVRAMARGIGGTLEIGSPDNPGTKATVEFACKDRA